MLHLMDVYLFVFLADYLAPRGLKGVLHLAVQLSGCTEFSSTVSRVHFNV